MNYKKDELKEIIKATLFVSGEGIEVDYLAEKLEVKPADIKKAVDALKNEIDENAGIQLIEFKNKIQLSSNPKYADAISSVLNPIREKALTKAALETIAIIAYKQPITRLEIEEIRGVGCDYALNALEEHKMIEVVGRKDAVGKPLLYGTTDEFLKRFGLLDLNALPNYDDLMERIAVIRESEMQKSDSLYRDYKLADLSQENQNPENVNIENVDNQNIIQSEDNAEDDKQELPEIDVNNALEKAKESLENLKENHNFENLA